MSTERGDDGSGSRVSSAGARFRRSSLILCAVLAMLALGLGAAGVVRPPSLVSASIAADRAVGTAGERLVMKGRIPVAPVEADQVTVTPAVPFTVQTSDSSVTLRFTAPLTYDTEYQVAIKGVRSQYTAHRCCPERGRGSAPGSGCWVSNWPSWPRARPAATVRGTAGRHRTRRRRLLPRTDVALLHGRDAHLRRSRGGCRRRALRL